MKEIIRINNLPKDNHNYIIQAKAKACDLDYKQIEVQLKKLFSEKE